MVNAGRILILTQGEWSNLVNYEQLDLVSYNKIAYLARQASVGVNPSTDISMTYWQPFGSVSDIATTTTPGLVMPDGDTIKIGTGGLIYVDIGADAVGYDNTSSDLSADDVQEAIDEAVQMVKMVRDGVATFEASSTASKAYSVGDVFFYNGHLYECTTAIAQGGTITPNTNCSITTINAQLKALRSTVLTATLAIGATSLTFNDASITTDSFVDAYSNVYGIAPTDITVTSGQAVLTFDAQESAITIKLVVK